MSYHSEYCLTYTAEDARMDKADGLPAVQFPKAPIQAAEPRHWRVKRWSGRDMDNVRVVFEGSEEGARAKFEAIKVALRQGFVKLISPSGEQIDYVVAFRNLTRW